MKISQRVTRMVTILVSPLLLLSVILSIYLGSIPEKYLLQPGDASPYDITAPKSIRNLAETEQRAQEASAQVANVLLRSEQIVQEVGEHVELFLALADQQRGIIESYTVIPETTPAIPAVTEPVQNPEVTASPTASPEPTLAPTPSPTPVAILNMDEQVAQLVQAMSTNLSIVLQAEDARAFLTMETSRYESVKGNINTLTGLIMSEPVDSAALRLSLSQKIESLSGNLTAYTEDATLIERSLSMLLEPNVVYDALATSNAKQAAYDKVMSNPTMIDKGTRIVTMGDTITEDTYALLIEFDLIDSGGFDYQYFAGIMILVGLLLFIAIFYLNKYEKAILKSGGDRVSLLLALLLPLFASVYLARQFPLSPPVYFAAVLISAYFGFRTSLLMSLLLTIAVLPMTGFDPVFPLIALSGSAVAALFTKGITRRDNYAFIIIATAGTNLVATFAFGIIQKEDWATITVNCGYTGVSGVLSVIAAIGIMPLFEMLFNTVSPLRLIELSQPGHPLLRRLFVEAPGSSQHSMMVANLADAAADAIGANPLLARVGAYYHDIGKLENPLMFTENQEGENPHDYLPPEQSAAIILSHPDNGVRIGRRYRLPGQILRIIHEHHGSTMQVFFYHKAKKLAEENHQPEPECSAFKYRCPIPSSQESAIVMLADSVEAAIKSTGTSRLEDVEALIRKIIKTKNEQDQLINSELSFKDVETLIKAFLQVYAGHFHERVKYPVQETSPD